MIRVYKLLAVFFVLFGLSACSTYPSKFKCGDARGLGCTMLSEVDRQIDNGKIEEVYQDKKCQKGASCNSKASLALSNKDIATLYDETFEESETEENNLYF